MLRARLFLALAAILGTLWAITHPAPWWGITRRELDTLDRHRFRGLAGLDTGGLSSTEAEFAAITRMRPRLALGWSNRALALSHAWLRSAEAVRYARRGIELTPGNPRAHLILAECLEQDRRPAEARAEWLRAAALAPGDARIVAMALAYLRTRGPGPDLEADALTRRLAELLPENGLVQVRAAQLDATRGDWYRALTLLERAEALHPRLEPGLRAEFAAVRTDVDRRGYADPEAVHRIAGRFLLVEQGKCAQAVGSPFARLALALTEWEPAPQLDPREEPDLPVRWAEVSAAYGLSGIRVPGIAPVVPVWRSVSVGSPPSFWPGIRALTPETPGLVLGDDTGAWTAPGARRRAPTRAGSAVVADLNGDHSLDLYSATPAGDRVWLNPARYGGDDPEKGWQDCWRGVERPMRQAARIPARGDGAPLAVDLDNDARPEILRPSSDPRQPALRLLHNEGRGTFSDQTRAAGLWLPSGGARQVVCGDFDGDGCLDLFLVRALGPSRLFVGDGGTGFRTVTGRGIFGAPGARWAALADFDRDGRWDLAVAGRNPHGTVLYHGEAGSFHAERIVGRGQFDGAVALDYDNDSWQDLALTGPSGVWLLHNDRGRLVRETRPVLREPCRWVGAVDLDADGDLDLLAVSSADAPRVLRNDGGNGNPWIAVRPWAFTHLAYPGQGQGRGAEAGEVRFRTAAGEQRLPPAAPLIHVGLGKSNRPGVITVVWPRTFDFYHFDPSPGQTLVIVQPVLG